MLTRYLNYCSEGLSRLVAIAKSLKMKPLNAVKHFGGVSGLV